jgi:putative addiction module CopG family antidote
MTIHLPEELERYILGQVQTGRFASADDAIAEAVRLLQQRGQEEAAPGGALTEEEWERRLVNAGLLREIPSPRRQVGGQRDYQPIRVEGESLSETVIRERR